MSSNDNTPYVSIIVDREVLPGKKEAFEEALKGIIEACKSFPGYLGTDVHMPEKENDNRYRVVFRFQTHEQFKDWEKSPLRLKWVEKINQLIKAPGQLQVISGLETWFALPRVAALVPPKRYKMAVVTWLAITPLLIAFNTLTQPILGKFPMIQRVLISTPFIVLLMTYLIMPYMAKLFARWLYPTQCKK